jgi:hypothetical protein
MDTFEYSLTEGDDLGEVHKYAYKWCDVNVHITGDKDDDRLAVSIYLDDYFTWDLAKTVRHEWSVKETFSSPQRLSKKFIKWVEELVTERIPEHRLYQSMTDEEKEVARENSPSQY